MITFHAIFHLNHKMSTASLTVSIQITNCSNTVIAVVMSKTQIYINHLTSVWICCTTPTMYQSHIPNCSIILQQKYAHFCYKLHCGIFVGWIMVFVKRANIHIATSCTEWYNMWNNIALTLIPAWMSNHMSSKMWVEITYLLPNFNGASVEVWEWISNFIPHLTMDLIT